MNYQQKTQHLSEIFANYLGDCDCEPNGDGTFHLISWDEGAGFIMKDAISISEAIRKNEFLQKCDEL